MLRYEEVSGKIAAMISQGIYRPGERIPSLRVLSRDMRVSINTVMGAYAQLENEGVIEARPQSGYYVCSFRAEHGRLTVPGKLGNPIAPRQVTLGDQTLRVMGNIANPNKIPLGSGFPNTALLPIDKLNRMLAVESRRFRVQSVSYASSNGMERLCTQIAKRSLSSGQMLAPEDIIITSGCVEAMTLALQAVCRPGDTVAIGSPVYYTFLKFMQWMGLKILEIPSTPERGISLDVLEYAVRQNSVNACLLIANFNNPLGSLMPDENKQRLVAFLAKHDIPLIEDDVYGDLAFNPTRPRSTKTFDENGLVLYCSSFSKTLAPGYRVGWIVPGKFREKILQLKTLFNIATASPTQLAIAEFITNGGYDHHLRKLRKTFERQTGRMRESICRYFPAETRVTNPQGGFFLWVELPGEVDAFMLYEAALREGISIAPGAIFTLEKRFRNCFRLNATFWSDQVEQALAILGGLAQGLHGGAISCRSKA